MLGEEKSKRLGLELRLQPVNFTETWHAPLRAAPHVVSASVWEVSLLTTQPLRIWLEMTVYRKIPWQCAELSCYATTSKGMLWSQA